MSIDLYVPTPPPQSADDLPLYLNNELQRLSALLASASEDVMNEMYVAPTKPQNGQMVYADGTTWNPSSGRGLYQYRSGTGWVFLG